MTNNGLTKAVEQFANLTQSISDIQLERAWAWQSYDEEGIRFAFFRTYEELRELAAKIRSERIARDRAPSAAQIILAGYAVAFWDLQAALIGLENDRIDQAPAENEWSVRKIFEHIIDAEVWFYVAIRYALDGHRSGDGRPPKITRVVRAGTSGIDEAAFRSMIEGPLEGLRHFHQTFHERVLREFADITDAELELPTEYWEKELMSIRFRLHRFDSHMRQHTIQLDKTTTAIQQLTTETKRLLRLIYAALADVNGALIGAWTMDENRRLELAQSISARAKEIAGLVA